MRAFSASGSLTLVLPECPSRKAHEPQNMISKKVGCLIKNVSIQYSTLLTLQPQILLSLSLKWLVCSEKDMYSLCRCTSCSATVLRSPNTRHGFLGFLALIGIFSFLVFLPRDTMLARYMLSSCHSCVWLRPSVCMFTFIHQKAGSNNRKAKKTNARKKSNAKT